MIAEIELAMLAALEQAETDNLLPFKWGNLETYPEDWSLYLKEKRGTITAPAAWVVFGGWRAPVDNSSWERHPARFAVVVMAENARSEEVRRHGDPADAGKPGSYILAEWVARILNGRSLTSGTDHMRLQSCRYVRAPEAFKERKVSMMAVEFETFIVLPDLVPEAELGDFVTVHSNWDIPILGGVGPDLPDDDAADATDHVTVRS